MLVAAEASVNVPANHKLWSDSLDRVTIGTIDGVFARLVDGMLLNILAMLSEDVSHEEILRDFPYLEPDDIKAALAYAARQSDHAVLQRS